MMVFRIVQRAIMIAVAAGACYALAERLGSLRAGLIWAAAVACGCALGAMLIASSPMGRITWRNRAAGYLIPWGWRLNRGQLWPVPFISWVIWICIGCMVFLLKPDTSDENPNFALRVALFVAWVLDASALIYVLGTIRQATSGAWLGSLWRLAVAITLIIAVSIGLHLGDMPIAALVVGGAPPAMLGVCAGLVVLFFMTFGRKIRWN